MPDDRALAWVDLQPSLEFGLLRSEILAARGYLGACRELAPSNQESTTYEPSLICKLLILGCRLLIPDRLLEVNDDGPAVHPVIHVRFHRCIQSGTLLFTETPKNRDTGHSSQ